MPDSSASKAASAAETALVAFAAALAYLIFHTTESAEVRPVVVVFCSLAMAISGVLHLVFVGLLATRCSKEPAKYVVGALLTLPVGSAIGLALYEWHTKVDNEAPRNGAA